MAQWLNLCLGFSASHPAPAGGLEKAVEDGSSALTPAAHGEDYEAPGFQLWPSSAHWVIWDEQINS